MTLYIPSKGIGKLDAEEIEETINSYAEDGALLHSITPIVDDGETDGYLISIDVTNMD